jgi:hypothetical protein
MFLLTIHRIFQHKFICFRVYLSLGEKMIEYILALVVLAALILLLSGKPRRGTRHLSDGQTMLYSHDSRDTSAEVYLPAFRDSAAPFPRSKREEREKTETYQPRR